MLQTRIMLLRKISKTTIDEKSVKQINTKGKGQNNRSVFVWELNWILFAFCWVKFYFRFFFLVSIDRKNTFSINLEHMICSHFKRIDLFSRCSPLRKRNIIILIVVVGHRLMFNCFRFRYLFRYVHWLKW